MKTVAGRKLHIISVYVDSELLTEIKERAKEEGYENISAFVRKVLKQYLNNK